MSVMGISYRFLNLIVASLLAIGVFSPFAGAVDDQTLDRLYAQLAEADPKDARRLAKEIEREWSQSGSPAMNLLLKRGSDAFEAGDTEAAIEHFTALTDHAPDFAEGWHRRAVAYAEAGLFGPALADIERTLALRPRHYEAIATLGGILAQTGRSEMAMEAFEQALAIHPHHPGIAEAMEHLAPRAGGMDL